MTDLSEDEMVSRSPARNRESEIPLVSFRGGIGAALFVIGLVVGLAGVKIGASWLAMFGIGLIVAGLGIINWSGKINGR